MRCPICRRSDPTTMKRFFWLCALLITLTARCGAGTLTPYTDPNQFLKVPFGAYSPWAQPWRAYLETMPATTFLNGTGINYQGNGSPDLEVQQLARHGIAHIRLEIGWGSVDFADETRLDNAARLAPILQACRKYGVRPLILLNAHQGAPCPVQFFSRTVAADAAAGQNTVQLTSVAGLTVGYSGLSNLSDYWAAEGLITAINGNTLTLSKPLPHALAAGAVVPMATLKYRPFSDSSTADYAATLAGWERYVTTVGTFVAACMDTGNPQDAGFDLEVWNELTFGSHFLNVNDYYNPPLEPTYKSSDTWSELPQATALVAAENPTVFAGVGISDGFANTIPWPASSQQPLGVSAISKHPYQGRKTFPMTMPSGQEAINGLLQVDRTGYQPSYTELFPEYFACDIQTENLERDMGPITSSLYGTMHGRDARTPPVSVWLTEVGIAPDQDDPTVDAPTALYLKAKTTARYFCFYLNKGVTLMTLFNDCAGDRDLGLVSDAFLTLAKTPGAVYPADDTALTSPALQVTGNIAQVMRTDLDPTLTPATTRLLTLLSVADTHDNAQFAGDGTPGHPPLYDRDVFAFLPFQANAHRFVIPYYVVTRDIRHVYDASQMGGHQYDMPAEAFTLTISGLQALDTVSAYDPMTDQSVPVTVVSATGSTATLQVQATDSPRLLVIQEKKTGVSLPAPSGLAATAGNGQVALSWATAAGAASYNLYRSTVSGAEGGTPYQTGLTATAFTDTSVTDGTTYYYKVTAVGAGESAPSNEAQATPLGPPTLTAAAAANPSAVTGTTTRLSVQAQDPQGQALTYTWSATGPAAVTYSANGTASAAVTTATFTKPGSYTFTVTVKNAGGLSASGSVAVTVTQTVTGMAVTPATATVAPGGRQQFQAAATDQFGGAMPITPAWSVSGGAISPGGLYTAGPTGGTVTVTAAQGLAGAAHAALAPAAAPSATSAPRTATALVTVAFPAPPAGVRINAGGGAAGSFAADGHYSGGRTAHTAAAASTAGVTNPAPQAVYQSERYGNFAYTVPNLTPGAAYTLRLHFAEIYWNGPGQRLFNVAVNGSLVLRNFDVFAATGGRNRAVVEQFPVTASGTGRITVTFTTLRDNAKVSGIEIVPGAAPTSTPPAAGTPAYEVNAGGGVTGAYGADADFSGGVTAANNDSITTSGVSDPAPQGVYQSERYGSFTYTVPNLTPGTAYTLRLHFAEIYWTRAGRRLFNVAVNGSQVLTDFDVFAAAGGKNRAVVETFPVRADASGRVVIQFTILRDNAKVSGIELTH